jgi:ABC-type multidrug transport system permease subunit
MNAFIALVRKDLVLHFSNRRAVLMSVVAPILIAAFFGSLFGASDKGPAQIPVVLTDLDQSELSARIVANLRGDPALRLSEAPTAEAQAQVRTGKQRAAVLLPAGFGAQASKALFGAATKPEVVVFYDPSQAMVLPMVKGLLAQHVMEPVSQSAFSSDSPVVRDVRAQMQQAGNLPEERRQALVSKFDSVARVQALPASASAADVAAAPVATSESAAVGAATPARGGLGIPFSTRDEAAVSELGAQYNSYAHSFAGMGVQFILLMGVDMGVGLLLMRRMGLWKRLRAAPLSKAQLLGSRTASCALIGLIVFAVVYAVAMAFFGVRISGSVPGFVAVLVAFALLTSSFGLMIAALGRTPDATRGLAILVTLLMVMLGGAWVPSFIFPPWLQTVSMWMPTHWAVDGLDAMTWRGLPVQDALLPVAALLGFTLLFSAVALARFQWEE